MSVVITDDLGAYLQELAQAIAIADKDILTQDDAVVYTKFCKDTLLKAQKKGDLEAICLGNRVLYEKAKLNKWMRGLPAWEPRGSR